MPVRAWAYWGLIVTGAVLLTLIMGMRAASEQVSLLTFAVLVFLATVGQFWEIRWGWLSRYPNVVPFFAGVVLLTPLAFSLLIIIPHLLEWLKRRQPWYIQTFNVAKTVCAGLLAQQSFIWLNGSIDSVSLTSSGAVVVAIVVYTFVDHLLVGQVAVLARPVTWSELGILKPGALATSGVMAGTGYVAALLWSLTVWTGSF